MIEAFWGRGYATESAGAMCRWALAQPGVTAVEAETAPDNAASIRVLAKLGFQPTGTLGEEGPRFLLKKSPDTPLLSHHVRQYAVSELNNISTEVPQC